MAHQATNTLRQENTALEDMSGIDPLTGLVNESTFMERGYQLLSYAIRHNSDLCIYRIEIDNFGELYREHGEEFTGSITQSIGEILTEQFGAKDLEGLWDYSNAKTLVMFCNGMWCGQSPNNIKNLLKFGYPADKIKWYRGGMQNWEILGLSTAKAVD